MQADEILLNAVFYALALLAAACGLGVAASRNIVRSAFSLLGVLAAVAGLYLVAWADFLFAVQVLIYIGGILVLLVFAVMLTHRIGDVRLSSESSSRLGPLLAVAWLFVALGMLIATTRWGPYEEYKLARRAAAPEAAILGPKSSDAPGSQPLTRQIAQELRTSHLLPFEAVGVLLLVAIVGASFLARKEVR